MSKTKKRRFRLHKKKYSWNKKLRHNCEKGDLELRVSLPISVYNKQEIQNIKELKRRMRVCGLPIGWTEQDHQQCLLLTKVNTATTDNETPITYLVKVDESLNLQIHVNGHALNLDQHHMLSVKEITSLRHLYDTLGYIRRCSICKGNEADEFNSVTDMQQVQHSTTAKVLNNPKCLILCDPNHSRCPSCTQFRSLLAVRKTRLSQSKPSYNKTDPKSTHRYSLLSKSEMKKRMTILHNEMVKIKKQRDRLKEKVNTLLEKQSTTTLNTSDHNDILQMMSMTTERVQKNGTQFQRLFWEQQLEAGKKRAKQGMRWHPLIIRWCIYLRHSSQRGYETMRETGILLPSQRTLRDYTHHTKAKPGFSGEVDAQLCQAAKIGECEEWQKHVVLLLDEMHIKEGLVFDKHTGDLVGFTELGDIKDQLEALEKNPVADSELPPELLANSMMTFMVKGLFLHIEFPYAYFPSRKVAGYMIFDHLWEAVTRLEQCGFKVVGCTSDGASVNRRLIRLHNSSRKMIYKTKNPCVTEGREFYFFSDPPHLLKTTRNCWASKSRNMWRNGKFIAWGQLRDLYNKTRTPSGLTILPRLKYEHINLSNFSKMRVDLAAQVLSESVSKAFQLYGGEEAKETALFTQTMDRFFDCLNVSNYENGKKKRKVFQNPYRSSTDFRIKWLEETFIPYLEEWEASVQQVKGFTNEQKNSLLLSIETRNGLKMTARSFIELVRYLFSVDGVKSFLSRRLCQDPLEKFFGSQRQIGRTHDNPTAKEFEQNTQILRVVHSFCRKSVWSNCRGNEDLNSGVNDQFDYSLPKRHRKSTQTEVALSRSTTAPLLDILDPCEAIILAVHDMLTDDSIFKTRKRAEIIQAATAFLELAKPPYTPSFVAFAEKLNTVMESCFTQQKTTKEEMEYIYTKFHIIRTLSTFHTAWNSFLLSFIQINPGPSFYQKITQNILKHRINHKYRSTHPACTTSNTDTPVSDLTNMEENAVRYFAGYLYHKITNKLINSNHPKRGILLSFLSELDEFELDPEMSDTESWTNLLDRGGLTHVSDSVYELFRQMELQIRKVYNVPQAVLNPHPKECVVQMIITSDSVVYEWQLLTENQEDLVSVDELLSMFVNEFVTVRGFYFTTSIIESYKRMTKINLQKKKGLRKSLPN